MEPVKLIFLDFDGVLRREGSPLYKLEPDLVANLESVVLNSPGLNVVITSSWREVYGLDHLRSLFSADFGSRIVGVTPIAKIRDEHYRFKEILAYLQRYGLEEEAWVAIDDDPLHFPAIAPVLFASPDKGFDGATASRLAELVSS